MALRQSFADGFPPILRQLQKLHSTGLVSHLHNFQVRRI